MAYIGLSQHIDFNKLSVPTERFELQHLIGEGTYGEVYCAKDHVSGKGVAIKILESITDNLEEIEEEFLVLKDLSKGHDNLPEFHGIFLKKGKHPEEDQLWFVMELCTGGSITDLVHELRQRNSRLNDNQIAYILRETVKALIYLHENHCMHRDIKGHNILLTERGDVKLVDFGVSSHLAATMARRNTSVGTPFWMSPEVIACEQQLDQSYDSRCDVWSLGIPAIELAEGDPPLCDLHPMRALFQIPRNPPPTLVHPDQFSPLLSDFISECLVKDFEERPFSKELLDHPFLKNINESLARKDLKQEIERQRAEGRGTTRPAEATTKYGKLKSDRKSKPEKMLIDDLAALEVLSEETIVKQLRKRFESDQIYTNIGDILIAVNPFESLGLYTQKYQRNYCGKSRADNSPHIFAVADTCHQTLIHQKQNQAIVISGESGSGKTESANLLLKQLVFLGQAPNRNMLEERILQVNPIMESFGNARTGINANSSRFGKYLELTMTRNGKVTGARISVYLLEQSRVVQQSENEGNFHIFYYMYDGLEADGKLQDYHLDVRFRKHHKYLKETCSNPKANQEKWKQLKSSFKVLGFKEDDVDSVIRVLAAILNLGDLHFTEVVTNDNTDNKARVVDMAPLHRVSKLLGVESSELLESLTSNSVVTRGETIIKNNTVEEASAARNAMAKALYGRLFDWMVNQINTLLVFNRPNMQEPLSIGLLDIFGFENFGKNSFEQLMINIANEQIQYYFNQHIFTWEQHEYMSEGIPVDLVEFSDNRPVLDMLLSRPLGLLALLDEESRFPKSSDRTLTDKFHGNIKSKYYQRPKSDAMCFAIHHFAGRVVYQADGFLEKNKNFLPAEVIHLVRQSQYDMIRFLFQCPITKTGNLYSALQDTGQVKGNFSNNLNSHFMKIDTKERFNSRGLASQSRAQQTVATYFRFSLMDLLQKMVSGQPQFVRCIKPNDIKASKNFDESKVIKQLRYTGVLETIKIRQNGFSHRLLFSDFLRKYSFLAYSFNERVKVNKECCRLLLVRLKMDGWALGKSKVFLKYYHIEFLSKVYEEQIRKIILVQACARRWLANRHFMKLKREQELSALTLQKHVRGWLTRRRFELMREKKIREKLEKERKDRENRISITPFISREALLRKLESQDRSHEKENRAAVVIQTYFRGYTLRKHKFSPEMEAKMKIILNTARSRHDAQKMMQKEKFKDEDIVRILQKYYTRGSRELISCSSPSDRKSMSDESSRRSRDHQLELLNFAQKLHILNQNVHKNLRNNKSGIPLSRIGDVPRDYRRPPGFSIVPNLLGTNQHLMNAVRSPSKTEMNEQMRGNSSDDYVSGSMSEMKTSTNWYNFMPSNPYINSRQHSKENLKAANRPLSNEYFRNVAAFNYLQPNALNENKVSSLSGDSRHLTKLYQEQLYKQQQYLASKKETEKKNKKNKKNKSKSNVQDDRILHNSNKEQPAKRYNIPSNHEYQNIVEDGGGVIKFREKKKTNDYNGKNYTKKSCCAIQDGIYVFNNVNSNASSLTSFAELEQKKNSPDIDVHTNNKLKHFNLSSYLNMDLKSSSSHDNESQRSSDDKSSIDKQTRRSSSKSSSLSNKSNDSVEKAIILNGLRNSEEKTNSYLGPFNFRKLLKPTGVAPTESLRKRKMILLNTSPPPDKNLKTNCH
ncbi:CLUMA_CG017591, isoform A [Clunio marinus]|uniref:non-specific serine/threonine protein kinase n=1 Tax=Clunio marinus TaxID=568069 RepID=A0A1J1IW58_9DIPT|nr:CLUMA_CG017591, isoform A [Clunio marinus]